VVLAGQDELEGGDLGRIRECAGEGQVKDAADGVDVGAAIGALAFELFGGEVAEFAAELAGAGAGSPLSSGLGDAEVGDFDLAFAVDEDVLRRDVAVDGAEGDAHGVGGFVEGVEASAGVRGDLCCDEGFEGAPGGGCQSSSQELRQGRTIHPFHDQEGVAGGLAQFRDFTQVSVAEGGGELGFVAEGACILNFISKLVQDGLDGDELGEAPCSAKCRAPHGPHTPDRERTE
jgi:hypothetical protein